MSDSVQWGDVPAWIEALSTLGALIVTAVALMYVIRTWNATKAQLTNAQAQLRAAWQAAEAGRKAAEHAEAQLSIAAGQEKLGYEMLGLERARDRERADIDAQARLDRESAKARTQADQVAAWITKSAFASGPPPTVRVVNHSTQPVYRFQLWFQAGEEVLSRPGHLNTLTQWMLAPVPTGSGESFLIGFDPEELAALEAAAKTGQPFGVGFAFTDIHGRDWTRNWNGELVPGRKPFMG